MVTLLSLAPERMLHTDSSREVTGPLEDTPRLRTLPLSEARLGQNFPSLCTKVQCQWLVCTQNPQRDTTLNQVQIIHFTHCTLLTALHCILVENYLYYLLPMTALRSQSFLCTRSLTRLSVPSWQSNIRTRAVYLVAPGTTSMSSSMWR